VLTIKRAGIVAGAVSAALAGALLSATPASAAAAKVAPASCYYVEQYTVEADGLRIHQRPATGSAGGVVLGLAYWPQTVISRRVPLYNAGYWWVYGQDQSTGVTGWMADEYLADDGDIGTCL
jgi:hypothetical protein